MTTTTQLVLPGEHLSIPSSSSITLGPGIASSSNNGFISTKLGLLRSSAGKSSKGKEKGTNYWIESNTKRVRELHPSIMVYTQSVPLMISISPHRRNWY